jgi:alginate O-acetyltransferase complex protein AlgI
MVFVPIYILILGGTIIVDYIAGIYLEKIQDKKYKRIFLILSLLTNIGILAVFKYYNFINANIDKVLHSVNLHTPFSYLKILLPIGLSFHTFQAMSYTIEVYRGNQKAEKHFGIYALYVMFYPQLVAGPIERPQNVLWQFHTKHKYDWEKIKSGLMQMAFGFFKKVVIADRLSVLVDSVYSAPEHKSGLTVIIASIFYAFQIYCDFSGYSDIAIGAARTMGFKLMDNFNVPYFSKSIGEFWSRWHISLSTWFRDYLYIPLGGNRVSMKRHYFNLMIVFLISGLWHGANWTFVIWGCIHGCYLIFGIIKNSFFKKIRKELPSKDKWYLSVLQVLSVFVLVTFAWIFFRSPNIKVAGIIIKRIFSFSFKDHIDYVTSKSEVYFSFLLIMLLMAKEKFLLNIPTKNNFLFYTGFPLLVFLCYFFGVFINNQFIYFQF